jgi:putative ABC transport system substrate-binding protein
MATAGDPARLGVVASFARPGGNLTGVTLYGTELNGKRIELFREAIPGIKRIEATARLTYLFWCGRWDSNPHDVAIEGF